MIKRAGPPIPAEAEAAGATPVVDRIRLAGLISVLRNKEANIDPSTLTPGERTIYDVLTRPFRMTPGDRKKMHEKIKGGLKSGKVPNDPYHQGVELALRNSYSVERNTHQIYDDQPDWITVDYNVELLLAEALKERMLDETGQSSADLQKLEGMIAAYDWVDGYRDSFEPTSPTES